MVFLLSTITTLLAIAQTASAHFLPPKGAITVGGKFGKYKTISAALNDTSSNVYFVYAGNYTEGVLIERPNIKIYGQTALPLSYLANTVTISRNMPATIAGSNDLSGTVRIRAANVSLYSLNIENTYGKPVDQAQAIALSVQNDKFAGYALSLSGNQDTLLSNGPGGEYFSHSLITGAVDFIFGMRASVWITNSVINTIGAGYITASGRVGEDANWYVIDHSLITGTNRDGSTFLGRPWRNYARVVFQNSFLDANINSTGWSIWTPTDQRTNHTTLGEYRNFGPGAAGQRADFSKKLNAEVDIKTVLNETSWIDPFFLKLQL